MFDVENQKQYVNNVGCYTNNAKVSEYKIKNVR